MNQYKINIQHKMTSIDWTADNEAGVLEIWYVNEKDEVEIDIFYYDDLMILSSHCKELETYLEKKKSI